MGWWRNTLLLMNTVLLFIYCDIVIAVVGIQTVPNKLCIDDLSPMYSYYR